MNLMMKYKNLDLFLLKKDENILITGELIDQ